MADPIRLAVVGIGRVAGRYAPEAAALRAAGRAVVTVTCDTDATREPFAQAMFGKTRFVTRWEDVVKSDDVDALAILTSMTEHAAITAAALQNGKHVFVEKPLATSLSDAAELVALSQADGAPYLGCAPSVALSPTFQSIWKRVTEGDIGAVRLARGRYGWSGPWWGQWFYRAGGGALFDLGVYNVTSFIGLLGPVRHVAAMAGTARPKRVVDGELIDVTVNDNFQVLLGFDDSTYAVVTTGFTIQAYKGAGLELYGDEGTIRMLGDDHAPAGYERWHLSRNVWETWPEAEPDWAWTAGLPHLVDCIEQGRRPVNSAEHAYHALEVMVKAEQAAREGRTIEIESTCDPLTLDPAAIELEVPQHVETYEHLVNRAQPAETAASSS